MTHNFLQHFKTPFESPTWSPSYHKCTRSPDCHLKPQELPPRGLLPVTPPLGNLTSTTLRESQVSPHARAGINPVLTASVTGPVIQHVLTPTVNLPDDIHSHDNHRSYYAWFPCPAACHPEIKTSQKDRKHRTSPKCALIACPGSQKASNCQNKCRDCGETSCRGRNSKRCIRCVAKVWDLW